MPVLTNSHKFVTWRKMLLYSILFDSLLIQCGSVESLEAIAKVLAEVISQSRA